MILAMIFCFSHANLCFSIVILESDGASLPTVYFILKSSELFKCPKDIQVQCASFLIPFLFYFRLLNNLLIHIHKDFSTFYSPHHLCLIHKNNGMLFFCFHFLLKSIQQKVAFTGACESKRVLIIPSSSQTLSLLRTRRNNAIII